MASSGILDGRRGLVVGIANERSLAYAIAHAARQAGATLALTYQSERHRRRVEDLAARLDAALVMPLDVTDDRQLADVAAALDPLWGRLDFAVHSVAYAERQDLDGRFVDTGRSGFHAAMDVSVYSLVAMARSLEDLLARGHGAPSLLTLSYYGAEKAMPSYNVMGVAKAALESAVRYLARDLGPRGIRVNALSAGAVKTLSAAGIRGMRRMLAHTAQVAPLRRGVSHEDVGHAALFALSHLGAAMTGEVYHVDAGYHAVGAAMPASEGPSSVDPSGKGTT